jgi:hypothetical protein
MSVAVAFGLRALTCALKARARMMTAKDLDDLDALRMDALPDRRDLAEMCARFREQCEAGRSYEAGAELIDQLGRMTSKETARIEGDLARTQAALATAGAADWQQRKDM